MADLYVNGILRTDVSDYSVTGDSLGLVPGDMTGGSGIMTFGLPDDDGSRNIENKPLELHDKYMGRTSGTLLIGGGNQIGVTINAVSKLGMLNVRRFAQPYSGTLRGAILYYFGLCNVASEIMVESGLATRTVNYVGWEGNVLDAIKDLCAAQTMDLSLIGTRFVFRPAGRRTLSLQTATPVDWQKDDSQLCQFVEVPYHLTAAPRRDLIYPLGGWNKDTQVFSVDAGETAEFRVTLAAPEDGGLGVSPISLEQPVCVDSVTPTQNSSSVYSVAGKDGLPVPTAQWKANGGDLTVALDEGGSVLVITVKGSAQEQYAPYSIAMTSGTSGGYSSLRVVGQGMFYDRKVLRGSTGVSADRASAETATDVSGTFITSKALATTLLARRKAKHGKTLTGLSFSMAKFTAEQQTSHSWFGGGSVNENLETHPFGNVEGSIFTWTDGRTYRVRSAVSTPDSTAIQAELYIV